MKSLRNHKLNYRTRRRGRVVLTSIIGILVLGFAYTQFYDSSKPTKPAAPNLLSKTTGPRKLEHGIALGNTLPPLSQAKRLDLLKKIKKDGFTEVRLNIDWSEVQAGGNTSYNWSNADAILGAVKTAGLKSIITLDRTPVWARPDSCKTQLFCPPADPAAFAKFSGLAAERYKNNSILAWEVWNEPNIVLFWPTLPNPNQYSHMLTAVSSAIKAKIPNAVVLVGGLAGNSVDINGSAYIDPRTFLAQIYAARAGKSFDGIAYHPYTSQRLPNTKDEYNGWYKMATGEFTMRSVMAVNGDLAKDLWVTEFGTPTGGSKGEAQDIGSIKSSEKTDHVSFDSQAQIAAAVIDSAKSYSWLRNIDWYTYQDGNGAAKNEGAAYGLLEFNGTPKPILKVIQDDMPRAVK